MSFCFLHDPLLRLRLILWSVSDKNNIFEELETQYPSKFRIQFV